MTNEQIILVQALVATLYQESADNDNMFAEAKAQWLESCLECADQYDYDELMADLDGDARYWAEQNYRDSGYEWMYRAVKQAEAEVYELGLYPYDLEPPVEQC